MVVVNNNWRQSQTRKHKYMSDQCTVSDEAFAYLVGKCHMMYWLERLYEKQKKPDGLPWKEIRRNGSNTGLAKMVLSEDPNNDSLVDAPTDDENEKRDEGIEKSKDSDGKNKIFVVDYVTLYNDLKKFKNDCPSDWSSWDEYYHGRFRESQKRNPDDEADTDSGKTRNKSSKDDSEQKKHLAMDYEDWE